MEERKKMSTWQLYMYMLSCAIHKENMESIKLDEYEKCTKDELIEVVKKQGQTMLLFEHIEAYGHYLEGWTDIYSNINAKILVGRTVYEYRKNMILRKVFEEGRKSGIKFVLFKGLVLADLYPNYTQRSSCDTDLFIDKKIKDRAIDLILGMGYEIVEDHCKDEVTVFHNEEYMHNIELHTCLWEDFKGKRMDILESFELTNPSHFVEMKACGIEITTLGYEDHLIYQMFHVIKHFSLEGVGCKYLVDVTLYVNKYGEKIDFESFWDKMNQLGYTRFCYFFFTICVEFLGMDKTILNGKNIPMGKEYLSFVEDLMRIGNRDDEKEASWQIMGMMTPYFTGEKTAKHTSFQRKLQVIFPRPKDLPDDLNYAKKCPILLPIAWVHKVARYLIKRKKHKDDWYNPSEKLNVADKRIKLMNDMGLVDEQ